MRRKRLVLIVVAFVVGVPLAVLAYPWVYMLGAGSLWDRAEREIHVIPAGYTGPVVIILNDSDAAWADARIDGPGGGMMSGSLTLWSMAGRPRGRWQQTER
ncbi:MAG TPA: hypothetical protein VN650_01100 [Gemmatimonadaceae bacterium]|nr:hypothetical protein [Gemmatimonadaceae bacterium]